MVFKKKYDNSQKSLNRLSFSLALVFLPYMKHESNKSYFLYTLNGYVSFTIVKNLHPTSGW